MDRDALVGLSRAEAWNRSLTRGQLRDLLALFDAKDARIRELEGQVVRPADRAPELVAEVRSVVGILRERVDALSEHIERR